METNLDVVDKSKLPLKGPFLRDPKEVWESSQASVDFEVFWQSGDRKSDYGTGRKQIAREAFLAARGFKS